MSAPKRRSLGNPLLLVLPEDAQDLENDTTTETRLNIIVQHGLQSNATLLDLSWLSLTQIPPKAFDMHLLKTLNLSNNGLNMLPPALATLSCLEELQLASNQFKVIDETTFATLARLAHLAKLDLSANKLETLGDSVTSLTGLTFLNLSYNKLCTIPDGICGMGRLAQLYLDHNMLETLPAQMNRCVGLSITLRHNRIEIVPPGLENFVVDNVATCIPNDVKCQLPRLFIGSWESAQNKHALIKRNITHILTLSNSDNMRPPFPNDYVYLVIPAEDSDSYVMSDNFDICNEFIDKGRRMGAVLVHCAQGISRCATIVLAYLMRTQGIRFNEAFDLLRNSHPSAQPNLNFVAQLRAYEAKLIGGADAEIIDENCRSSSS